MSKNCKHKTPCGCKDSAQTTPPPCNEAPPCTGEPCSEVFCQECISYCNDSFKVVFDDADFLVNKGDRLDVILQKMLVFMAGPEECGEHTALGVHSTLILEDQIDIEWTAPATETFNVTCVDPNGIQVVSPNLAAGVNSYSITGLVPNTTYQVFVTNAVDNCLSPILSITTQNS